jgi:hypothetical protein
MEGAVQGINSVRFLSAPSQVISARRFLLVKGALSLYKQKTARQRSRLFEKQDKLSSNIK